ncbi:nitrilase-related carbon-nitrogen hydrolase [Actinomadura roseirufa]|uniref:nitrilase-related carbon-nitrogen hydrolase n=1 Tax=Actinomadura roseirufa TaxID=2094049 RepID=UPI001F5E8C1F|nr:nitrilase-related carbon-nitrogen hydrolase [Actinomadura roseirufa]
MREPITVAVVQPHCTPHDVGANALAHAAAVRSAGARVVVFPELSLTGYELDAPAVDPGDPRLEPLMRACAETGTLALAGAPVRHGDGEAIAMLAIETDVAVAYRKIYLGDAEAERFTPDTEPAVLTVGGWRLGLAICKDTRVPEHASATAALGIDVYVAAIAEEADRAQEQAEWARRVAVGHGVWSVVASFAGTTGGLGPVMGRSAVRRPDGTVVAEAGPEPGAMARATLTPTALPAVPAVPVMSSVSRVSTVPAGPSMSAVPSISTVPAAPAASAVPAASAQPIPSAGPVVIDGGDRSCVRLLLELRAHLTDLPPGTVVHLIATDPAAPIDLPAWCHLTGHAYLGTVCGDRPTYALQVSESPRPTDPASPWRPG